MTDEERIEGEGAKDEASAQPPLPEASFIMLAATLHSQALVYLGMVPEEGEVNLPVAKFTIDLLGVLEEKTAGNLTEEETQFLKNLLFELRMKFVEVSRDVG